MKKKIVVLLTLLLGLAVVAACQNKEEATAEEYNIYYVNNDETELVPVIYKMKSLETKEMLDELITVLSKDPESVDYRKPCLEDVTIEDYALENEQVTISFSKEYLSMDEIQEVLCRSAVVKTLVQIPGIKYVSFNIGDVPLADVNGNPVGIMTEESFVENEGEAINSISSARISLFFANEDGTKLVEEVQDVHYSTSMSLEKVILEQLIAGPTVDGVYPVISPETKVLGVSIKDGICYANLDSSVLLQTYNVTEEVLAYSIVNSLTGVTGISKVQLTVNGDSNLNLRESISLNTMFERNLDLVESIDTTEEVTIPEE